MAKGIMIGVIGTILCGLCLAALPYGADLASVYVRQMDTRDPIYNRVIMPSKEFVTQFGGLTERNVTFFNLSAMPEIIAELNKLRADQVNTEVDNALADYDGPTDTEMVAYFAALNDITVAEIMAAVIEGPITLVKAMRGLISRELGKASGGGTTTVIWRDTQDTKDRVTMTVDTSGNRTGVVTDLD